MAAATLSATVKLGRTSRAVGIPAPVARTAARAPDQNEEMETES